MRQKFVIRRNPFVMLKQIIILEVAIGIIYLIPTFFENQNLFGIETATLYSQISFSIFAISLQIALISMVFARWYLTQYIVTKSKIIVRNNFLAKKEENFRLENITSILLFQNIFNKISNSGSLIGKDVEGNELFKLKDIPDPGYHLSIIEEMEERKEVRQTFKNVREILKTGENQNIEFKSTFLWDQKKKDTNKDMQYSIMKTLAGFMNTQGGTLLIGVNDKREVIGLEDDIKNLKKKDLDGYENFFNLVFTNMIGLEYRNCVEITFEKIDENDICIINVKPSQKPVYIKNKKYEEFYIRAGNATHPLRISEATRYIEDRFKKNLK